MRTVLISTLDSIDFAPASELAEVVQNVKTILTTIKGTVPLDRSFGVSSDALDRPTPAAKAALTAEIVEQVEASEPRAQIQKVAFSGDSNGRLVPTLEVKLDVS